MILKKKSGAVPVDSVLYEIWSVKYVDPTEKDNMFHDSDVVEMQGDFSSYQPEICLQVFWRVASVVLEQ